MTTELEAEGNEIVGLVDWSLYVDCPKCGESNNLADSDHDPEFEIARLVFSNRWDRLRGWEVTCEHCEHEFKLDRVEY